MAADESKPRYGEPTSRCAAADAGCPIHAWSAPVTVAHSTTVPPWHGCQTVKWTAAFEGSGLIVGVGGHLSCAAIVFYLSTVAGSWSG